MTTQPEARGTFIYFGSLYLSLRDIALSAIDELSLRVAQLWRRGPPWTMTASVTLPPDHDATVDSADEREQTRRLAIALAQALRSLPPETARAYAEHSSSNRDVGGPDRRDVFLRVFVEVLDHLSIQDYEAMPVMFPWMFEPDTGDRDTP